ncbi:MAG: hypothetical protein V8S83_08175 [Oscillospiraceae bacterium]
MQKRVISGILALALVLTLTLAQADVRVEVDGIDGGSASVTASEDDSAALLEGYLYQVNGLDVPEVVKAESSGNTASRPATYAVALNDVTNNIYRRLVPEIKKIAAGESASATIVITDMPITYTQEVLGHITIIEGGALSKAASAKIDELFGADVNHDALLSKLLANMPYELYWFDKTNGMAISYGIEADENTVTIPYIAVGFCVADAYRDTTKYAVNEKGETILDEANNPVPDYTAVDTAKTGAATAAAAKAAEVVAKNQGKGAYSKLVAYADYIKNAVSYNYAAADKNNYGDPWQLIYVFDENPDTNVVCEGYSKAFKYLCDLTWTGSDPEVACYLPTGTMNGGTGAGLHMWNIVSIGGANYLTDITNCDSGTIGAPDQLFLCGAEGSVDASYAAATTNGTVTYVYDQNTKDIYDQELVLSETKYSPLAFDLNQLIALARYAAGITTDKSAAIDVNKDGIISAADLTAMAQSLVS